MKLCVAGGGKMAEALIGGLIATEWSDAPGIGVIEIDPGRRETLAETFPGLVVAESAASAVVDPRFDATDLLVAVKPQHVATVGAELAGAGVQRVLSIAAGVRLDALLDAFADARVVRAMPNTPALVGQGAAAIAASANAGPDDIAWATSILTAVGTVAVVEEAELDAVTGLSGSGPAYIFLLAEAMTAAGVAQGLAPAVADALTRQTVLGAASLLAASGDVGPAELRANVTSPGGTTAAAIAVMHDRGLVEIVDAAIAAATERSVELGQG